ncbi:MAG: hypothetical protein R2788_06280 [Saprospiraceae bacterium]
MTCVTPVAADERTAIFQQLQLSPVPTTNVLNVDFTALSQQDAQLSIYETWRVEGIYPNVQSNGSRQPHQLGC